MLIFIMILSIPAMAQAASIDNEPTSISEYIIVIGGIFCSLITILKMISKIIPTSEKYNKAVMFLEKLGTLFLPDLKKGGGTH